ncbi:MAG: MotA/TolQ/ExbB proton channel family protein [Alphaproteobacteria bacterium]|nr:MAG: MotA/TolQ/ExbB proton channel family protein [Alphaproteobacteria bacterium]
MQVDYAHIIGRIDWLMAKGGPVIVIIAGLSLLTLTLFIAKLLQYWRLGMFRPGRVDPAIACWERQDPARARAALSAMRGCVAETLRAAMGEPSGPLRAVATREAETARIAHAFLAQAQAGFRVFELIITAAPLLGLLGTVLGMIEAFRRIELEATQVNPGLLAGGIWEALLTTAAGMVVALVALSALHVLEALVERTRHVLEDRSNRILNAAGRAEATA